MTSDRESGGDAAIRASGNSIPSGGTVRRDGAERIKAALERLPEPGAKKKAGEQDRARCSTTDPTATVTRRGRHDQQTDEMRIIPSLRERSVLGECGLALINILGRFFRF